MTNRASPVTEIMTTGPATVRADDSVDTAMRVLVERGVGAAPVVDADGTVVGMLSNSDLIVQESRLHFPTLLSFLGASIEIGHKRFEEELEAALAATVADVMTADPVSCTEGCTIEDAATLMHDNDIGEIVVLRDGKLVGMVSRNDVLRAILAD